MKEISINEGIKLSEHFTLGELTKTSYHTKDGNVPSRVAIENLRRLCEGWLEDLRYSYNRLYGDSQEIPVIISSGYRSAEVNARCGGSPSSNHLTGCAVDIRCMGPEQQIRYAGILLDIADGTQRDFDELILEKRGTTYWIHFAVRPPLTPPVGGGNSGGAPPVGGGNAGGGSPVGGGNAGGVSPVGGGNAGEVSPVGGGKSRTEGLAACGNRRRIRFDMR